MQRPLLAFLQHDMQTHARAVAVQMLLTMVHVLNAAWSHWCVCYASLCARVCPWWVHAATAASKNVL
jgi:hypothetical protein